MIVINFNKPEFEYDVHSLIKAFFPKEDVKMLYEKNDEEAEHVFYVDYLENKISIKWLIGG